MSKAKNPAEHLPEKPPKRTGRAGVGPVPEPGTTTVEEFVKTVAETRDQKMGKKAKAPELLKEPRLPGMENPAIEEIESAAKQYAQVRDRRMALTEQEVDMKDLLLTLMKRHGKKEYRHAGIEIRVVAEAEKVKVRIEEE